MDLATVVTAVGGSAVVAAGVGALASALVQAAFKHHLDSSLEQLKDHLERIKRLEADLLKSRGAAYRMIWTITQKLNLFGTPTPIDKGTLSRDMTNWYFQQGWVLTDEAKKHYFLVQEVINFASLKGIPLERPDAARLFGSSERPDDVLRTLRKNHFGPEVGAKGPSYEALVAMVVKWKVQEARSAQEELAWVVLQATMSSFRSAITRDLSSRETVRAASVPT